MTNPILRPFPLFLLCCWFLVSCHAGETKASKDANTHAHKPVDPKGETYATAVNNGTIAADTMKGSPQRTAMANIGDCHVHIQYSSPGVKGRIIWGGLVPYNHVWVTGAHKATTIQFSSAIAINGKPLAAGEYAFFTIPGENSWTLIFNKNTEQHLTDEYDPAEDVLRLEVKPDSLPNKVQRLTYTVDTKEAQTGTVGMEWDQLRIAFEVTAKN